MDNNSSTYNYDVVLKDSLFVNNLFEKKPIFNFHDIDNLFISNRKESIPLKVIKINSKNIIESHLKKLCEQNVINENQVDDINDNIRQYIDHLIADKNIKLDDESYDWIISLVINLIYETQKTESEI
ncbi:MAG: hypothetical protein K8823_113 [Cenarchaeum symbiont of Oopsacas minuta]|nr:hypothetical protein [Cenarchaeum symbiont of Oopsacas minuta]